MPWRVGPAEGEASDDPGAVVRSSDDPKPESMGSLSSYGRGGIHGRIRIPILMYHQVTAAPLPALARYTVSPTAFAAQMRWLAITGHTPINLDRLIEHRRGGSLPRRPVVITFDDGFEDLLDHAVPTLVGRGFTATIFLVAGLLGRGAAWLKEVGGDGLRLLDPAAAGRLAAAGFEIGAHTRTHPRLTDIAPEACLRELRSSRDLLEQTLGRDVLHLAYPFGSHDERVVAMAGRAGFSTACTTLRAIATDRDALLALPRISVYRHDSLFDFVWRLRTALSPREAWRARRRTARSSFRSARNV